MHSCKKFVLQTMLYNNKLTYNEIQNISKDIDICIKTNQPEKYIMDIFMNTFFIKFTYSLSYMVSYRKEWKDKPLSAIFNLSMNHFCEQIPKENPIDLNHYINTLKKEWINNYGY